MKLVSALLLQIKNNEYIVANRSADQSMAGYHELRGGRIEPNAVSAIVGPGKVALEIRIIGNGCVALVGCNPCIGRKNRRGEQRDGCDGNFLHEEPPGLGTEEVEMPGTEL